MATKNYVTYKDKYNKKYGYANNSSHTLEEVSKDTGVSIKGLQQIYNKGIGAYKTNPTSVRPNVKSKEQWAMARVYSAVMSGKASNIDSNELKMEKGGLIAPNGKPSNLTPEQYKLVRTKEFKDWFGDWENDPENASKVVDENGEPLVVWHGSKSFDINEFDLSKSKRKSSGLKEFGTYFTDNKNLAKAYRNWGELNKDEELDIDIQIYKWKKIRDESRNNRDYHNAEEQIARLEESKKGRIYGVFLNLKKLYVFDAKGGVNIEAWNNLEVKASYKWATNRDAMEFLKEGKFGVEKVDGIKAENIVDAFVQTEELKKELLSNVYLVFDSKNIKLADGTNTTFDGSNPDIRFEEGGAIGVQTSKLIEELKKYSNYEQGEISTNAEGEKYRYHYWKLKYRSASNWLVQLFMRASKENTGVDYNKRFAVGDYSFYYDRPEMKGKPNGSMKMRKLEVLGKYEKGGKTSSNNMSYIDIKNSLIDAMQEYAENKKASERDNLWNSVYNGFKFIDESRAFKDSSNSKFVTDIKEELFPLVIEANSKLPKTSKYVIGDLDYAHTSFVEDLPKSYIDYLPKANTKEIKVKQLWDSNDDKVKLSPNDKVFVDFFKDWVSDDDLRPQMQGVYVDEFGATATNMHLLIHIAKNAIKSDVAQDVIYSLKDGGKPIEQRYPNYRGVSDINKTELLTSIDCQIMVNALNIILNNGLVNKTTKEVGIKKGDKEIKFNAEYLLVNFQTWLKMGVRYVDVYINKSDLYNKQVVLCIKKDGYSYNQDAIDYTLLMPIMGYNTYSTSTIIEIIDENNVDVIVSLSPAYRIGDDKNDSRDIDSIIADLKELMPFLSKEEKAKTKSLIADLQLASKYLYAEGGKITQYEIQSMRNYINSENPNPKIKASFEKVLAKYQVEANRSDLSAFPQGKYINPYEFSGYEYMRGLNQEAGVSFLLTGEYELVSKAIYEKDYAMWLFYSYLGRINISFKACQDWLNQAQEYFQYTMPIPIWLVHTPRAKDGRSYAMWWAVSEDRKAQAESRVGRPLVFDYNGTYYYQEIGMVGNFDGNNDGWGTLYKEKKTGLLIPEYTETSFHFSTLIHEFAHCLDFQTQLVENIEKFKLKPVKSETYLNTEKMTDSELALYSKQIEKESKQGEGVSRPITNHFDEFVDALIRILRACAGGHIPLTQLYEQQALDVQQALAGTYGDLLLAQRERLAKERKELAKEDELRENKRFTWQSSWINDIKQYVIDNALQIDLKEKLNRNAKIDFTLTEAIELDNLITGYFNTEFRKYMIKNPSKATQRLEDIKMLKKETNRIINNHYDNVKSGYRYGFSPQNELEKYIDANCKIRDFRDYKSWKECAKESLQNFQ